MVPFIVDRLWRAVSMVFSGRFNNLSIHACTIKNSASDTVFKSSLGHSSGLGALPGFRQYLMYFVISWLLSAPRPRHKPCVKLAVLHASILSLVISSSASIVLLLCRKSVKCQHPWQKATSSRLLCSAVSCGILAQVLLALLQFGSRYCAAAFSFQVLSSRTDLDLTLLYIYGISYLYKQI